jgi:membrane protein implicated in regulation of membrane protease activity
MFIMFILMFLPLIALPVFWFLPLGQAILVYLVAILLSASMFWIMRRTKRHPVTTGMESLSGKDTIVVAKSGDSNRATYTVRVEGELWNARSRDVLQPGEKVIIIGTEGNRLVVKHKNRDDAEKLEQAQTGGKLP